MRHTYNIEDADTGEIKATVDSDSVVTADDFHFGGNVKITRVSNARRIEQRQPKPSELPDSFKARQHILFSGTPEQKEEYIKVNARDFDKLQELLILICRAIT